jgi:long-chain acyl-CoA synthetase
VIAQLAAWKLGAIVAPLNPIYTEPEIEAALNENGVESILTLTRFYERVKRAQPRTPLIRVIATNIKEYFPPLLKFLFTVAREKAAGDRVTPVAGDHEFGALLRAHSHATTFPRATLPYC